MLESWELILGLITTFVSGLGIGYIKGYNRGQACIAKAMSNSLSSVQSSSSSQERCGGKS